MHTAPIANLPIHPTPALERHEFHDKDFAVHLREEARGNSRYDDPRPARHDDSNRTKAGTHTPKEDHPRLSPDDGAASVAQPETPEKPTASQSQTDLPASDTETPDAGAALDQPQVATQPVTTEPVTPQPLVPELVGPVADAATAETAPIQISNFSLPTTPDLALAIDGATDISASTPAATAPVIDGEPALVVPTSPETSATGMETRFE